MKNKQRTWKHLVLTVLMGLIMTMPVQIWAAGTKTAGWSSSGSSGYYWGGWGDSNLATPVLNSLTVNGGVKLTWNKVTGAVKYRIYRKSVDGQYQKIGETNSTSYTDTTTGNNGTYTYTVCCINYNGTTETSSYDPDGLTIIFAPDTGTISVTKDQTLIYFPNSSYQLDPVSVNGFQDVVFDLNGAEVHCSGVYFIKAENCPDLTVENGTISDCYSNGIYIMNCKGTVIRECVVSGIGNVSQAEAAGIKMLGANDGFLIEDCTVTDVHAGAVASDGFIHAYGIQINRLNSNKSFSKTGTIRNCTISQVAGIDTADKKADGEGVFINAAPYQDDNGNIVWHEAEILVENCTIRDCKKRGVKATAKGVTIRECVFSGDFYYAAIDLQYGHCTVTGCDITNTSDYTKTLTSGIVASDGDITVTGCTIRCPYTNTEGKKVYHPGIRFGNRIPKSVIPKTAAWGDCIIDDCYFDQVSRAVYANTGNTNEDSYVLNKLAVNNCQFGKTNQKYLVEIRDSKFNRILDFEMTDYQFDAGSTLQAVRSQNPAFEKAAAFDTEPDTCTIRSSYFTS